MTNVKVVEVVPRTLRVFKSYIGHLKPRNRVIVRSETSGTIEKMTFEEGEKVSFGEELVHISTNELALRKVIAETNFDQAVSDYQVERKLYFNSPSSCQENSPCESMHVDLKTIRLQADLAKADYQHAHSELKIQEQLFEKNMTSSASYETFRTTAEMKRITWQQAELSFQQAKIRDLHRLENYQNVVKINEVNLKLASLQLNKSKVKAPFGGVVTKKMAQLGGFIQNGTDLLEVMDISSVMVRISIPEKEMQYAAVGKRVSVKLDALPGEAFQGKIKTLGLEADLRCRCFPADILIGNSHQKLLPGMMARVEMLAKSDSHQIIVPRHAVLERQSGTVVFVVKDEKAVQVPVVIGDMIGEDVSIKEGLNFGDRLIIVGQNLLANQDPVNVVNQNQKLAQR
ncbi:MAG: efflux RND transporter periplasmic adaptor subunit [bacterium]